MAKSRRCVRNSNPRAVTAEKRPLERNGVRVGRMYTVAGDTLLVKSIHQNKGGSWSARVKNFQKGHETGIALSQLAKAVHSRAKHPVAECYAVGPERIRRRKVNPRKQLRKPFSGCYTVGLGRIRRRKVNRKVKRKQLKKPFSGCYTVGLGRIRRRKVNPVERFYIFVHSSGRRWLRFDTHGDFSVTRDGRSFATPGEAWKQASKLRRQYPKELRKRVLYVSDRWPTKI